MTPAKAPDVTGTSSVPAVAGTPSAPAEPVRPVSRAAVLLTGLLLLAVPVPAEPVWASLIGAAGLTAAFVPHLTALIRRMVTSRRPALSRRFRPAEWAGPGTFIAAAAIAECAVSRLNAAALAAEGLLLLGYLLLLDTPTGVRWSATARWLRSRIRAVLAGVTATGLVLAGLAAAPSVAPWILLAGLAAAITAYLVAIPRHPDHAGEAGDSAAGDSS
ncbi:MAG TPA: hypothetical protein VGI74_01840 [Streptosporangiaceae bacterium]